jgi:hypothetical protein
MIAIGAERCRYGDVRRKAALFIKTGAKTIL